MPTVEEIVNSVDDSLDDEKQVVLSSTEASGDGYHVGDIEEVHDDDLDDDIDDETLGERLLGLTEMFPAPVCSAVTTGISLMWNGSCWLWRSSRTGLWVVASSAAILALPVMFENERAQMEEQQVQQQRQILLGPNAASAGGHGLVPGGLPKIVPPGR